MSNIKVAIIEDQQATREGLAILISNTPEFEVTGRFASVEQALDWLDADPPHVLLMDIGLPGMSGIEGVTEVRSRHPHIKILMLTVYGDDQHVFEAICAGACGYLLKGTPRDRLLAAIREMRYGGAP